MKRIVLLGLGIVASSIIAALPVGCGGPQVKPDREQIQRRSDKSFHDLEREEQERQE